MECFTAIVSEWWEGVRLPIALAAQTDLQYALDEVVEDIQWVPTPFFTESDIMPGCPSLVMRSLMNAALRGIEHANQEFRSVSSRPIGTNTSEYASP